MGKEKKSSSFFTRPLLVSRMSTATATTTKRSPSPPPFSIAEFTSLVSAALDTDRFDPDSSQILSFTSTSQKVVDVIMPHACFPTPFSTAHLSMSTLHLNSESSSPPAPSRPMALFQRIKRQATSAFVGRNPQATATHTRLTHPTTTTTVSFAPFPSYHPAPRSSSITTESRPSFFEDDSDSEEDVLSDAGRTEESDYIPYIPLIIQHERSLQNHLSLRPISVYARSPPSPTPSGSTTSTRSPVTPLTPLFSQNRHGGPPPSETQRWSLCNDGDIGEDSLSLSTSTDDADPFAKASVQIVRSSISSGSVYSLPSAHSKSWSPPKVCCFSLSMHTTQCFFFVEFQDEETQTDPTGPMQTAPPLSAPHRPQFQLPDPRRTSFLIRKRQRLSASALLSTASINLTHHPAPHRATNGGLQQRSSPTKRARARGALRANDTYGCRQGMDITFGRTFFSFSLF